MILPEDADRLKPEFSLSQFSLFCRENLLLISDCLALLHQSAAGSGRLLPPDVVLVLLELLLVLLLLVGGGVAQLHPGTDGHDQGDPGLGRLVEMSAPDPSPLHHPSDGGTEGETEEVQVLPGDPVVLVQSPQLRQVGQHPVHLVHVGNYPGE